MKKNSKSAIGWVHVGYTFNGKKHRYFINDEEVTATEFKKLSPYLPSILKPKRKVKK